METTDMPAGLDAPAAGPADVLRSRLDDPATAAALVTILDNAELLSTLVLGLAGATSRGEVIIDSISTGVQEMKAASPAASLDLPSVEAVIELFNALTGSLPVIQTLLTSSVLSPDAVALTSMVSDAAIEGVAAARRSRSPGSGPVALLRSLRDPDVARGLGVVIEISRSLGRRMAAGS